MAINPILNIDNSVDFQVFEFESKGNTTLRKRIQFYLIDPVEQIYNLALCTVLANGILDCDSDTRNGDMDAVLETTAHVGIVYINQFPDRKIYLRGSDGKRSRKYQMGINSHLEHLAKDYFIEGLIIVNNQIVLRESFQIGSKQEIPRQLTVQTKE